MVHEAMGSDTPLLLSKLRRARTLRPRVIQMVTEFGNSSRTAENLLRAIETDLNDPSARRAFEAHAPAIVQKLAMIDETKADHQSVRTVELEIDGSEPLTVELVLNARGRTTLTIIEDLYGCLLVDALDEGIRALVQQAERRAQEEFNDEAADGGPMNAGPPTTLFMER